MGVNYVNYGRGKSIHNAVGLILYLCGGWRSYQDICDEFEWIATRTARRNVAALEQVGLPIEYAEHRIRLPQDWIGRTLWLRRYIILKTPLNQPAYLRSLHK